MPALSGRQFTALCITQRCNHIDCEAYYILRASSCNVPIFVAYSYYRMHQCSMQHNRHTIYISFITPERPNNDAASLRNELKLSESIHFSWLVVYLFIIHGRVPNAPVCVPLIKPAVTQLLLQSPLCSLIVLYRGFNRPPLTRSGRVPIDKPTGRVCQEYLCHN